MPHYVLLLRPSANRVYQEATSTLALGELGVFNETLFDSSLQHISELLLANVPYIQFETETLSDTQCQLIGCLSSFYALYEVVSDGLLRPLPVSGLDRLDDDLITIPKYKGKTNEMFTQMLLNVTVASSAFAELMPTRELFICDPMCGRGTTLNQAAMYGWNAAGIDIDKRDLEAYDQFLRIYLKKKRLKHNIESGTIRRNKKAVGWKMDVTFAATKEEYKAGHRFRIQTFCDDTRSASSYFKAETFHALVTDLPYGVRHGSHKKDEDLSRRPLALLEAVLPGWIALLKPGGTIGLGWNRKVAGRDKAIELLLANGLHVFDSPAYDMFRHTVDQSIERDILVAQKPLPT
jgi:hypothetical protein